MVAQTMLAQTMFAQNVVFGILAVVMVAAAFRLVTTQNVVRAALFLAIVLAGAAGLYILLAAEFVAWVQVLVYIGAVVVLLLFGVMLTRAPIGREADLDNDQRLVGALVALFLFGALGAVLLDAFGDDKVGEFSIRRTAEVSDSLFGAYVVPFEVSSVLLLAALVGAVALARRD
jgi:NADH-quinone oxidoreductase subunit J